MLNTLRIYTDGSTNPNPGCGAYAYIILDNNNVVIRKYAMSFESTTNNRMELMPLIFALQWLRSEPVAINKHSTYDKIIITSDSEYLILGVKGRMAKWKNNEWRSTSGKVVNIDLWKKLDDLLQVFFNIEFRLVKGHSGDNYNEMVDKLAVQERLEKKNLAEDFEYIKSIETKQMNLFIR